MPKLEPGFYEVGTGWFAYVNNRSYFKYIHPEINKFWRVTNINFFNRIQEFYI